MIASLAFGAFLLCMALIVWDAIREHRRPVKWGEEIPVISGFQALETLRRAESRKP